MGTKLVHDISSGRMVEQALTADEIAAAEARREAAETRDALKQAEATEREAARAEIVAARADVLLVQIAAGLTANQSDQDAADNATTLAAMRPILGRMLQREEGMMRALDAIVKYLRANA